MKKDMNIGIIGAGLIGGKRAGIIVSSKRGKLVAIADPDFARAKALAEKYNVAAIADWKELVKRDDIDVVIIAVPNAFLAPIVLAALKNGKHILCEKPFGVNVKESKNMLAAAAKAKKIVKVGFNHRFHAGLLKAHEIVTRGGIGKIFFIRARYGHGGRKGMEKEWRFNPKISGGGELLDQGVHIVDLARWFAGDFKTVYGAARTKFWRTSVDDNTFAIMENKNTTVSFHVSTTQWKNMFSFEIYGELGYLQIEGKNGSYGQEVLTHGKRNLGFAPETETFTFGLEDVSWEREWDNFMDAIEKKGKVVGDAKDGLKANELIEAIYRSSKTHKEVKLK